ncbi:MAG: enoyl-CoA hydratase/isomerase family protein [Oceanospirillaceae bacterium]|nr:enoyl-CoA hydratase/isomerase family protein [Oceanospirillaceae bacterium]
MQIKTADSITCITLNRPDKLNSFNEQMHSELAHAFKGVAGDDAVRCVVITGAGRGFCAGQYLSDEALNIDSGPAALGDSLECNYNPLIRKISA